MSPKIGSSREQRVSRREQSVGSESEAGRCGTVQPASGPTTQINHGINSHNTVHHPAEFLGVW